MHLQYQLAFYYFLVTIEYVNTARNTKQPEMGHDIMAGNYIENALNLLN